LRILLIVNSFASSVTARTTVLVQQALEDGNEVQLVETNRRGHATRFAQDAAKRGLDVVVALGVTEPSTKRPTGSRAPTARWRRFPAARRTSSPARSDCRTIRSPPPE
jgi:hypothetical protein